MAIHFFHITEGDEFISDPEGTEQPDFAAVEKAAIESAGSLIAEAVKRGVRDYRGRLDVEDELGQRVLALTFACPIHIAVVPPPTPVS